MSVGAIGQESHRDHDPTNGAVVVDQGVVIRPQPVKLVTRPGEVVAPAQVTPSKRREGFDEVVVQQHNNGVQVQYNLDQRQITVNAQNHRKTSSPASVDRDPDTLVCNRNAIGANAATVVLPKRRHGARKQSTDAIDSWTWRQDRHLKAVFNYPDPGSVPMSLLRSRTSTEFRNVLLSHIQGKTLQQAIRRADELNLI
uniref:Uncharacterized protein n=1 Tax=Spongospora subterranea TaxID=70186 RepID=A0A0H5R0I9_9EUKA|eukprot:CRZ07487.1 hypothetical protein [Spongospora subterranea]